MDKVTKLSAAARRAGMTKIPDWKKVRGRDAIARRYTFNDFSAAFSWMTRVAMKAEEMGHHPEWANIYNGVDVVLTTHDADGVSQLDIDMARFMDKIAPRQKK
jgi:4a-hydroxytetrahydrobiopterin dehydratase